MKILLAIITEYHGARSFEMNTFLPACRLLGETYLFPMTQIRLESGKSAMNRQFLNVVEGFKPDAVFTLAFEDEWEDGTVEQVPVPTICWFSDAYRREYVYTEAHRYSHVVVMDHIAQEVVAWHPNVMRSMWACNPHLHVPGNLHRDIPVVFVGGTHGGRTALISRARRMGLGILDTGGYGGNRFVPAEEYVRLHQRAKIGLSFTTSADGKTQSPKARTFEVPAMRAMLLSEESPFVDEYLEEGKEYISFRTAEELVEKARFYLDGDGWEEIARAGCTRVHAEHTYDKRLREVFQWALSTQV